MDEIIITTPEKIKQIIDGCLTEFLNRNIKTETPVPDNDYLKSIKEIAEFLSCSITTAQKIKNQNRNIFIQVGRKFMVKKADLIDALKIKSKH